VKDTLIFLTSIFLFIFCTLLIGHSLSVVFHTEWDYLTKIAVGFWILIVCSLIDELVKRRKGGKRRKRGKEVNDKCR